MDDNNTYNTSQAGQQTASTSKPRYYGPMSESLKAIFKEASRGTPRYLFRVWGPATDSTSCHPGATLSDKDYKHETSELIIPHAFYKQYNRLHDEDLISYHKAPENFEELDDKQVKKIMDEHMDYNASNNGTVFTSWTASFRTLQQHSRDRADTRISVIDTSRLNHNVNTVIHLDARISSLTGRHIFPEEYLVYWPVRPVFTIPILGTDETVCFMHIPLLTDSPVVSPADPGFRTWLIENAKAFGTMFPENLRFVVAVSFIGAVATIDEIGRIDQEALKSCADALRSLWQLPGTLDIAEFMDESTLGPTPRDQWQTFHLYKLLQDYYTNTDRQAASAQV